MKYKIALHQTEEGYSASVPSLPGCWSEGDTEEEALENIRLAIKEYMAALDELLEGATIREIEVTAQEGTEKPRYRSEEPYPEAHTG